MHPTTVLVDVFRSGSVGFGSYDHADKWLAWPLIKPEKRSTPANGVSVSNCYTTDANLVKR